MNPEILPWIYTAAAILLGSLGHILLKQHAVTSSYKFLFLSILAFVSVPALSFLALRDLTIAQVYLCTALVPIITTFGAWLVVKEVITKHHLIGLVFITIGTFLYLYPSLNLTFA